MATYTTNYNLKKPDPTDFADIADLNENADIIDAALKEKADLDESGKLSEDQLPTLDYIPTSQKGAASGVATLGTDGKVPTEQLPSMDYIPTSQKGAAGGVATLGADGKIPSSQLGAVGVPPQIIVTAPSGSAVTCTDGTTSLSGTSTGTVTFDLTNYGSWTVTASLDGQTSTETVVVDDVKQYEIELTYFSATLNVTSDEGAVVTASNGARTFTGTVPSGGVLALTITAAGTYSVSATLNGETTDAVSVAVTTSGATYTAECLFYSSTFADNTWEQIAKASSEGIASTLWSVGDEKDITVSGETLTLVILGFGHDDLADGSGKAGITLGLKNLMASTRQMNSSNTNSGGFTGSAMYTWLQGTLLSSLPSDLQAVLKSVSKKTSTGSQSSTINTNSMKIFLFSEIEIFGSITYSKSGEGEQYDYFATTANRIKYLSNGSGSADWWWERSPYGSGSTYFCVVSSGGYANFANASYASGVCFGFCV